MLPSAEFKKVTEIDPAFADGFISLGQAYMESGDYGSAIPPLKHALELNADSLPAHQLLGYALLSQGYASEAIPHLQRLARQNRVGNCADSDRPTAGGRSKSAGCSGGASQRSRSSLLPGPRQRPAGETIDRHFVRRVSRFRPRAPGDGGKLFRAAPHAGRRKRIPRSAAVCGPALPEAHLALGEVYAGAFQWPKAEEEFRIQVKLQPGNAEAAYRLGQALLEQGKAHEARAELVRADRLLPDMPETLYSLGKAASLEGDAAAAEKAWTKLLSIEKQSSLAAQAHFGLAGIYRKQGKTAEAQARNARIPKLAKQFVSAAIFRTTRFATLAGALTVIREDEDMEAMRNRLMWNLYSALLDCLLCGAGLLLLCVIGALPLTAAEPSSQDPGLGMAVPGRG